MTDVSIPAEGATGTPRSFYDAVGGEETFRRLVHHFYAGVPDDPVLGRLYAESDLAAAEERLRMFLVQYWGGPRTYSELRGHPRLRMRHVSFRVGTRERDAWLARMRAAMDDVALPQEADTMLWDYLVMAANSLVNAPDQPLDDSVLLPVATEPEG